ncbi:MAG: hypothetical protein CMJ75_17700 [Planctomycetaceae bacterium]|nr:hypothetical protein [Planctomycetaceae bacterium]
MTSDWLLALEQTGAMEVVRGSRAKVAEAVQRGADLRLFLVARGYEETLYFQQTYAGKSDAFAGLMTHHHSHEHRGQALVEPYFSFFKYDSLGAFSHIKWLPDNQVLQEPQPYQYGVYRWYVCDRWRVIYEHDKDGNALAGDLEELKDLIRRGCSLKVGVEQLFNLPGAGEQGPAHVCFLTIMQPLIKDGHVGANCDFVLSGTPQWPWSWEDEISLGMVWPWSSGEVIGHWAKPGALPFTREKAQCAMRWLVADRG